MEKKLDSYFFQAEDGIRDAQESRGLGDVYKRQIRLLTGKHYYLFGYPKESTKNFSKIE